MFSPFLQTKFVLPKDVALSQDLVCCLLGGMTPLLKSEVSEPVILEMLQATAV